MVTLKDVAKASGVSTATVSYVVNDGPRHVLPETRARVLKAVEELGYHPNAAARSLMGKLTRTFGVVFPHVAGSPLDNQYFAAVLAGVIDSATARKQNAMLFTGMSWEEAERNVPLFCDGRCDGFIFVAPPPESELIKTLTARNTRVTVVGTRSTFVEVGTVDVDNVEGSRLATQHLLDLGHRRIGLFHSDSPSSSTPERIQGFRKAMETAGIPPADGPIFSFRHPEETAYDVAREILQSATGKRITGMVCLYDSAATMMMEAATSLGLQVPQDLSVIGFDDVPLAATAVPPLTTMRQPLRKIGALASSMLFDLIENDELEPTEMLLDVELVVRASTGPANS